MKTFLYLLGLALLGILPFAFLGGIIYLLYLWSGTAQGAMNLFFVGIVGLIVATILFFILALIGGKIWLGDLDAKPGRGGLSKPFHKWKDLQEQKKEAKLATKKQDGQLSETNAAVGQLSHVRPLGPHTEAECDPRCSLHKKGTLADLAFEDGRIFND